MDTDPSQTIMDTKQEDNQTVLMIPADQPNTWTIQSLSPHSTVQVWLKAHNKIGFSEESSVLVQTPAGMTYHTTCNRQEKCQDCSVSSSPASVLTLTQTSSSTSSLGHHSVLTIFAFIILTVIFVDFVTYKTYHKGNYWFIFTYAVILPTK